MSIWKKCPCGQRVASRPNGLCATCDKAGRPLVKTCRHCSKGKVSRPRGLCWNCYYTPGVKDLYPSTSKYAPRQSGWVGEETSSGRLPAEPTDAPPGSLAKMRVMRQRLLRKESLFHPLDNQFPDAGLVKPFPDTRRWAEGTGLDDDGVATLPLGEAA